MKIMGLISNTTVNALLAGVVITTTMSMGAVNAQNTTAYASSASDMALVGAGSTFAAPIVTAWLSKYGESSPALTLTYNAIGSGDGISRFLADAVDFGMTDAAVDVADLPEGALQVPVTAGSISLVYNLGDLAQPLTLSREAYTGIFLGRIIRWDDPLIAQTNPGIKLPPKLIQVVGRQDSSGTTFAVTSHLAAVSEDARNELGAAKVVDWPGGAMLARGNEGVAQRVRLTLGSIGYVESGFAQRLGLTAARLENAAGAELAPTPEAARAALEAVTSANADELSVAVTDPAADNAYPLVTYSFWLQRRGNSARSAAMVDVLKWVLTEGQALAEPLGYVALPESISKAALAEINREAS